MFPNDDQVVVASFNTLLSSFHLFVETKEKIENCACLKRKPRD
jgi:hypothetical protein